MKRSVEIKKKGEKRNRSVWSGVLFILKSITILPVNF